MQFKHTKKETAMSAGELESLDAKFADKVQDKEIKKYYTLFLSQATMAKLEGYLEEFGRFKENKSTFIQEALEEHLKRKKEQIKQELSEKLEKLQD
ncbi:hypothetical protein NHP190002_15500 [Helicobacter ailurogastricus]|uniref:hypothetical protein n=1 Tax=Helicobacter ailurogastricus TaxID=1578720 RepID=UPI00244D81FA|nr:hypothetical protein [Helicobacter ailurogastricus]GMB90819.1 hypothetical protein NHP190002_15500 [Helicobacter ailurogastricus]